MSKPNRDYWRRRFEILEQSAADKGGAYAASLDREYKTAMQDVEAKIAKWYQRFADNNGITLSEAKKWMSGKDLKEFKWSVDDYIRFGEENALNQQWMAQLENASAKVHVSRLEALQVEMQQSIEALYGNQLDGIDNLARKIYTDTFYHTAFEVQKGFNVGWDLTPIDRKQLDKVVSKPWTLDSETFSDRIWKQKNALVSKVQTELSQSLLRGDSPDRAIKSIAKEFDVSRSQAGRLVMTESAYFASVGQKDCFNELDVEKFEIVATLDSHTSELCQSLDGHVEDMKDYEAGVTAPPFHPWCRTTTIPYFDDNYGERAARGADGKTYYVPSDMKYADWKSSFVTGGGSGAGKVALETTTSPAKGVTLKQQLVDDISKTAPSGFTKEQVTEYQEKLKNMTSDELGMWDKLSIHFPNNEYVLSGVTAGYYPLLHKIEMDINDVYWENLVGISTKGAWKDKFHEELHQLNHLVGRNQSGISSRRFTNVGTPAGDALYKAAESDVLTVYNKAIAKYNKTVTVKADKLAKITDFSFLTDPSKADKINNALKKFLTDAYPTDKDKALMGALADAISGVTKGQFDTQSMGFWAHEANYYTSESIVTNELHSEIGAIQLLRITKSSAALRKTMPNSWKAVKKTLKAEIAFVKTNSIVY